MLPGISAAKRNPLSNPFKELGLLTLSAALFSFSFPNPVLNWGFFPTAFFALWPIISVVNRCSWPRLFFYAPVFGLLSYSLFNYWLAAFHPLALTIVSITYALWFLLLFPLLKLTRQFLPRFGWILQILLWVSWEYIRTTGFLGYPYGILGYSQFTFPAFANSASWIGIWGVTALVVWPSFLLAWKDSPIRRVSPKKHSFTSSVFDGLKLLCTKFVAVRYALLVWGALLIAACAFGLVSMVDYQAAPVKKIALVQQNVDPWIGGTPAYAESLRRLIRQTDLALSQHPDLEMIVWSETSFVPAIEWHWRYREDPNRFELVRQLKEYLAQSPIPFLLGNGEAEPFLNQAGNRGRKDFNAALLYEQGVQVASYRKVRLVPFTEHFPYRDQLPWLYDLLVENNTSFWEEGKNMVLMDAAGFSFGTPICYEDSFPEISRQLVLGGAEMIINLSNDSWSKSVPAAMQHLAMATFRAIEARRTVVRSTNGGMSGLIDPNGIITALNEPFTESFIVVNAPVYVGKPTLALLWGDWVAWLCIYGSAIFVLGGLIVRTLGSKWPRVKNAD